MDRYIYIYAYNTGTYILPLYEPPFDGTQKNMDLISVEIDSKVAFHGRGLNLYGVSRLSGYDTFFSPSVTLFELGPRRLFSCAIRPPFPLCHLRQSVISIFLWCSSISLVPTSQFAHLSLTVGNPE
jgi:hypothetical protein